ncbi:MAG: ExeA family protein, partial [Burkholderiaceae bacterium]
MTVKIQPSMNRADPPEGVRLDLLSIAQERKISLVDMGAVAGISRTAVYQIGAENRWPVKTEPHLIRAAIRKLFEDNGASDEQLASLFCAHVKRRTHAQRSGGAPVPKAEREQAPPTNDDEVTDMLPTKQTLSSPASKAFRVFANPFDGDVIDDAQMFTSGEVAFAREACLQAATGGRFVALVGESGAGKTTVLADLEARIEKDKRPVIVIRPSVLGMEGNDTTGKAVKASELLMAIVQTLNPLATVRQTLQGRTKQVERLLADSCEAGNKHLLLIEEAHCLPAATLKHLKRMNELKLGRTPMLGILLVAQPELKDILRHQASYLREVIQRLEVVDLLPLDND